MGADCKSVGLAYEGSNPSPATPALRPGSQRCEPGRSRCAAVDQLAGGQTTTRWKDSAARAPAALYVATKTPLGSAPSCAVVANPAEADPAPVVPMLATYAHCRTSL